MVLNLSRWHWPTGRRHIQWNWSLSNQENRHRMPLSKGLTGLIVQKYSIFICSERWMKYRKLRRNGYQNITVNARMNHWTIWHRRNTDFTIICRVLKKCMELKRVYLQCPQDNHVLPCWELIFVSTLPVLPTTAHMVEPLFIISLACWYERPLSTINYQLSTINCAHSSLNSGLKVHLVFLFTTSPVLC